MLEKGGTLSCFSEAVLGALIPNDEVYFLCLAPGIE
jgi:hypothetical protein